MLVRLRREYANLVTSASQLILLLVGFQLGSRQAWLACLTLMAALSLITWMSALRRHRAMVHTPTSKVASAAQGYVELVGRGKALEGLPVLSPINGLPCLWYRCVIERRHNDKWVKESDTMSDASFILHDATGQCLIDPDGAEMLLRGRERWTNGDYRYTQWMLVENDPLYALGSFDTKGSVDLQGDVNEDTKALISEWKSRPHELLRRFDLDGNGEIDLREWSLARAQARREVMAARRDTARHAELHTLSRPVDGRLYLISNIEPSKLERRYRAWSAFHLSVFFGSLVAMGWLLETAR